MARKANVKIEINPAFFPEYEGRVDDLIRDVSDASVLLSYKHAPDRWSSIIDKMRVGKKRRNGTRAVLMDHHATYWMHNGFMHARKKKFIPGIRFFARAAQEAGAKVTGSLK